MPKKPVPKELQQQMAASVAGTGPSFVPAAPAPKPVKPEVPAIEDLIADTEEVSTLRELIRVQLPLNARKKEIEKQLEPINDRIKGIVSQYGFTEARCDNAKVNYYPTERKVLDPLLLVAAGVDQEVIDACYRVTTSYTLKVTA